MGRVGVLALRYRTSGGLRSALLAAWLPLWAAPGVRWPRLAAPDLAGAALLSVCRRPSLCLSARPPARACLQWQAECLYQGDVLDGGNLVYCAPTSGGKSLVAEVLMLRALCLDPSRQAVLVLPLKSMCAEKAAWLDRLLAPLERKVQRFWGGQGQPAPLFHAGVGVIVCTIEKANIM